MGSVTVCFKSQVCETPRGRHMFGAVHFTDGTRYEGNMLNSLPHGHGRMFFTNGDRYEGFFKRGLRHGTGTYTFNLAKVCMAGHWQKDEFVWGTTSTIVKA